MTLSLCVVPFFSLFFFSSPQASDGEGILEQSAFTADESDMAHCDIVGATEDFLRKHMKTVKDIVRKEGKHTSSSSKGAGSGKGSQKEK